MVRSEGEGREALIDRKGGFEIVIVLETLTLLLDFWCSSKFTKAWKQS